MAGKTSAAPLEFAGEVRMISSRPDVPTSLPASENDELRNAMRVLGAVVEELAERVELLETRETVRLARTNV